MKSVVQEFAARAASMALLLPLSLALSGCSAKQPPLNVPYQPANFGAPDAVVVEEAAVAKGQSKINPYDKVEIKVFQVEDLSGEFQVNSAGQISYPLIGTIAAGGKTPAELSQFISSRLGAKYLRSPNVQVNIMEAEPLERTVTVDGSVKTPGAFPVRGPITLMRAVALAQGLADNADPKRVIIFRTVNGQRMAGAFDLAAIRRAEAEDPLVYASDIVVIDAKRDSPFREIFDRAMQTIPTLAIFRPF